MTIFDRPEKTRIVDELDATDRLGEFVRELGGTRALLVSSPGLVNAGHVARAEAALRRAGVAFASFTEVCENPTTDDVDRCLEAARAFGPDLFVGFGGGSAIDTAKGANFLLCCGGRMRDYWGSDKATAPLLPLLAVPTTAGTGSEVQSYALVAEAQTQRKMACGDPDAAPRMAVLDASLSVTQPPRVTICTGLDAIGHAVETCVTKARTETSSAYSTEAFARAVRAFPAVLERPRDLGARAEMLRAATLAGLAIEHSMLGGAHALANPLTQHHGLPHGQAVATMLPFVVELNAQDAASAERYAELARHASLVSAGSSTEEGVRALCAVLRRFLTLGDLPQSLAGLALAEADLERLAAGAAEQWTGGFNPRSLGVADFRGVLERASAASGASTGASDR